MKKQTILKLIVAAICVMTCMSAYAVTAAKIEEAEQWFLSKARGVHLVGGSGLLYNEYLDKAVWYTLYQWNQSGPDVKVSYGCLAPNSFRFVTYPSNKDGNSYKVLIEVKDRLDCGGGNVCQTDSKQFSAARVGKLPEFVISHKNGNNCYISYDTYPSFGGNYGYTKQAEKLLYANFQQENFKEPEPSPLNVSVKNAFYGVEGQPTWEINGKKIVDIIQASQSDAASLYIPANMNQYFGKDPLVNQPKIVAVQILVDGKLINLRQKEGKELKYPGVEGTDYWIVK